MTKPPLLHRFGCWCVGFGLTLCAKRDAQQTAASVPFALLGQAMIAKLNLVDRRDTRAATHAKRRTRV